MADQASCLFVIKRDRNDKKFLILARRAPFKDAARTDKQSLAYVLQPPVHGKARIGERSWGTLLAETYEEQGRPFFCFVEAHTASCATIPSPASNPDLACWFIFVTEEEAALMHPCTEIAEMVEIPLTELTGFEPVLMARDKGGVAPDSRIMFGDHIEVMLYLQQLFAGE